MRNCNAHSILLQSNINIDKIKKRASLLLPFYVDKSKLEPRTKNPNSNCKIPSTQTELRLYTNIRTCDKNRAVLGHRNQHFAHHAFEVYTWRKQLAIIIIILANSNADSLLVIRLHMVCMYEHWTLYAKSTIAVLMFNTTHCVRLVCECKFRSS